MIVNMTAKRQAILYHTVRVAQQFSVLALAFNTVLYWIVLLNVEISGTAARETVGPHDVTSLATTAMSLGLVRAAQGRDEEAEELLREAYDTIST